MDFSTQVSSVKTASDIVEWLFKASVYRHVLNNGLTLVHRPDFSSEVVSVQVWVKTGSIHEGSLMGSGLSHYLEHLLFKGTTLREGKSISREVHAMGSSINAYTTFDRTVYYFDGPSIAFKAAVDLLADIVLCSTLPEEEVEREREVILREIDMGLDDPDQKLSQALFRTAFQKHPYREPVIGHRELYERVSREDLIAYYRARYVPNNMVISVAGSISWEDCSRFVEERFASEPRGLLLPVLLESESVQLTPRREDIIGEYNVVRGDMGFKVPNFSHEDSPSLDVLAYALGGGEDSILWERLRNQKNLVHYIDCRNWNPGSSGLLCISYVCDPGKGAVVESAVWSVIQNVIRNGLAELVVDKARRQSLVAEVDVRKTMNGQASRLGFGEVVVGDINYMRHYFSRLQTVSTKELQEVAIRYLVEEGMSTVTLGPKSETDDTEANPKDVLPPNPFKLVELDGGLRLLIQEDHRLPKVHLCCVLLGGPMYEPANQRGVSSLLAELLIKDTANRRASEIAEFIESLGGKMVASAGNNTIHLSIEVLPADIDVAIELLADALLCPIFETDTLQTELEAQIAELKERDDDILEYGFRKLREYFFGSHPFAIGADGRIEDLRSLRKADIKAYYEQIVLSENAVLSVCGAFDPIAVQSQLNETIATKILSAPFVKSDLPAYDGPKAVNLIKHMNREQAVVLQAFPDVGILDDDFVVGEVLNELFNGMSSHLFERVRDDKSLAYYVGSTRILGLKSSLFALYAGTQSTQIDEVIKEMNRELVRVATGHVLENELARCRTRLKAARLIGRQTIGARAINAAIHLTYGLPPLYDDDEYAAKLDTCDSAKLAEFAGGFLIPKRRVQLVVRAKKP